MSSAKTTAPVRSIIILSIGHCKSYLVFLQGANESLDIGLVVVSLILPFRNVLGAIDRVIICPEKYLDLHQVAVMKHSAL